MKNLHYVLFFVLVLVSCPSRVSSQNVIPLPAHGTSFTGNSRGYWFTAPCDFRITGVRAPADFSVNAQSIHLVKFTTAPATWPSTSTNFTTLFYGSNITDTCYSYLDIQVLAGEFIGVLGVRNNGSGLAITSYTTANSPIASSIGSYTISLARLGTQSNIINGAAVDFFTEGGNPIGRVEIIYELLPAKVPVPAHATNFSGNSRGFWFTAPCDFLLTGVRAPTDFSTNPQSIHLVKFTAAPPIYTSTTTAFTTLFYGANIGDTGFINLSVQIYSGDIIGVMAVRNNGSGGSVTSYTSASSPISSSLGSHTISLARLGWQGSIISSAAANFWTENTAPIGRAELRYEFPSVYRFNPGSLISNSIPFLEPSSGNNKRQWIYHPADFRCTPKGYITSIYLKASTTVSPSLSGFLIRMGTTSLSSFSGTTFATGLDTVLYNTTANLVSIGENWIRIRLQRPFFYDGVSNFVVEASQQGFSPGFWVMQTSANATGRSMLGNSASASGSVQDRLASFGFEILTSYTDACLVAFVDPPPAFCEGTKPVVVQLANYSSDTLTSAMIHLDLNGNPQASVSWTGMLLPYGGSAPVLLCNFPFSNNSSPFVLNAYVTQPNNQTDVNTYNDTIVRPGVVAYPLPAVSLGSDITLKMGASVVLNAGAGFSTYLWSTGSTSQTTLVDSTGTGVGAKPVWVKVTDSNGCDNSDTVLVTFIDDSGIETTDRAPIINLHPNPSDGKFSLHLIKFTPGKYQIRVLGYEGNPLIEHTIEISEPESSMNLDLSGFSSGIYLIQITGIENTFVQKVIISR
ncbi:MAG TPA: T9SS type A sorting domain-containing protein [Bacteroidales bacterium]|nr:T9SS type A sorting domain-containing protein [Bacteroidales bacterium]